MPFCGGVAIKSIRIVVGPEGGAGKFGGAVVELKFSQFTPTS